MRSLLFSSFAYQCWLTLAQASRSKLGELCQESKDCVSQHCLPMCEEQSKICMEPEWIFKRHNLNTPACADKNLIENYKKFKTVPVSQIGETCHTDSNCFSEQCIPECGDDSDIWRCIESELFQKRYNLKRPVCIDKHIAFALSSTNNFQATRKVGEPCAASNECVSGNCVPVCENPKIGSLCIENKRSFEMHKILTPTCIEKGSSIELVNKVRFTNKRLETQGRGSLKSLLQQYDQLSNSQRKVTKNNFDVVLDEEVQHLMSVSKDKNQVLGQIKQLKDMYEAERTRKEEQKKQKDEEMKEKLKAEGKLEELKKVEEDHGKSSMVEESNIIDWAKEEQEILRLVEEREKKSNGIEEENEQLSMVETNEIINWAKEEQEILRLAEGRERERNVVEENGKLNNVDENEIINWAGEEKEILRLAEERERKRKGVVDEHEKLIRNERNEVIKLAEEEQKILRIVEEREKRNNEELERLRMVEKYNTLHRIEEQGQGTKEQEKQRMAEMYNTKYRIEEDKTLHSANEQKKERVGQVNNPLLQIGEQEKLRNEMKNDMVEIQEKLNIVEDPEKLRKTVEEREEKLRAYDREQIRKSNEKKRLNLVEEKEQLRREIDKEKSRIEKEQGNQRTAEAERMKALEQEKDRLQVKLRTAEKERGELIRKIKDEREILRSVEEKEKLRSQIQENLRRIEITSTQLQVELRQVSKEQDELLGKVGEEREVLRNSEEEEKLRTQLQERLRDAEKEQEELQRKIETEQNELQRKIEAEEEKLRNVENQINFEAGKQDKLQRVETRKKIPLVEVGKEMEWSKEEQEILNRAEEHGKELAEGNRLEIDQTEKEQGKSHAAPKGNVIESALNGLQWDSQQANERDEVNVVDSFFKNEAIKIRDRGSRNKRSRWTNIEKNAQRWAKINKEREQNKNFLTKHAQQKAEFKRENERQVKEEQEKRKAEVKRENERLAREEQEKLRKAEQEKQKAEEREKLRQTEEQRKREEEEQRKAEEREKLRQAEEQRKREEEEQRKAEERENLRQAEEQRKREQREKLRQAEEQRKREQQEKLHHILNEDKLKFEQQQNQLEEDKEHLLRKITKLESEILETERLGIDVKSNEGIGTNNDTNKSKHKLSYLFALFSFVLVIVLSVTAHCRHGPRSKLTQNERLLN